MENASKALIMAAGVLIGILILSLAVYLFVSFGTTSAELHRQNDANRTNEFNTQFTKYVGSDDITIYTIVSLANIATENNIEYELPKVSTIINDNNYSKFYVQIVFNNKPIEGGYNTPSATNYNTLIKNDTEQISAANQNLKTYECTTYISSSTQRVYKVVFNEK